MLLEQVLSGTVYSFATVLTVFLVGIAFGSKAFRDYGGRLSPLVLFVILELVLAGYTIASASLIRAMSVFAEELGRAVGFGFIARGVILESLLGSFLLLVPAFCFGVLFPLLLNLGCAPRGSSTWGFFVGANTAGCVLGPLVAGMVLLPTLGLKGLLTAALPWTLAMGVVFFTSLRRRPWPSIAGGLSVLALLFFAPGDLLLWAEHGERLIDHREDPAAAVSVVEYEGSNRQKRLKINRKFSLGGGRGVFTERRQGHLPMLLHPGPERVLVLGVGTGNTLGAVSLYRPRSLLGVELVQSVLDLAQQHFAETNERVLDNPRVKVLCADALRVVRTPPERYDVIIADLFHPWQAGVGSLYSREHFHAVRRALADGGIFCQWLPLYQLAPDDLRIIVRTFLSVYPAVSGWFGNFGSTTLVLALVGSEQPVRLRWVRWERAKAAPELVATLRATYLDRPAEIVGAYVGGRAELMAFAGVGPLNTITRPTIEFSAPRALFAESLQADKRRSLDALVRLNPGDVPLEASAAGTAPNPDEVRIHVQVVRLMIRAFLEQESGNTAAALRLARESVRRAQSYDVPAMVLAELAWGAHENYPELAEEAFREALRVRPDDIRALTGLGTVCLSLHRLDQAAEAFRRILGLRPDWPAAVEGLRRIQRLKGSS